jgi:signal transduction histidine kinase
LAGGQHEAPASDAANHALIVRNLTPVLQNIAAGAAQVSVTCPASLPPLDFTSDILERITVNLVRNAAEALRIQRWRTDSPTPPRRGEIRVSLAVVGRHLLLTVEDNGPGMPPAIAAKFLRPSPLPRGATHGLGHRIVRELATATDGQLSIRVLPGSGTVFSILWPIPASPRHDSPCLDASQPRSSTNPSFPSLQPLDKEQALANT